MFVIFLFVRSVLHGLSAFVCVLFGFVCGISAVYVVVFCVFCSSIFCDEENATTPLYTLCLHYALPIFNSQPLLGCCVVRKPSSASCLL